MKPLSLTLVESVASAEFAEAARAAADAAAADAVAMDVSVSSFAS